MTCFIEAVDRKGMTHDTPSYGRDTVIACPTVMSCRFTSSKEAADRPLFNVHRLPHIPYDVAFKKQAHDELSSGEVNGSIQLVTIPSRLFTTYT